MTQHSALPSAWHGLWRIAFGLVALLWWLLLAACIISAGAWAALYFYFAPHIADYKAAMERIGSEKTGLQVRIGSVHATQDLIPQFELRDVRVTDQAQHHAVQLPLVLAGVSWRSLWHLRLESMRLVAPQLEVRRDATGRIFVGGLDFSKGVGGSGSEAADWFFSIRRFSVQSGQLRWSDEKRQLAPLQLQDVQISIHNQRYQHRFYVSATPDSAWGDPFEIQAQFHAPLLEKRVGSWRAWKGVIYSNMPFVNVAYLDAYLDPQLTIDYGTGSVRAWAEVAHSSVQGLTLDVGLGPSSLRLGPELENLAFEHLTGRIKAKRSEHGFSLATQNLQFSTSEGPQWLRGDFALDFQAADSPQAGGKLQAQDVNLQTMAQLAARLPISPKILAALATFKPQGVVEQAELSWQGSVEAPTQYQAKGKLTGLALAAKAPEVAAIPAALETPSVGPALPALPAVANAAPAIAAAPGIERPGFAGLDVSFDLRETGGRAQLALHQGWLEFPGVFAEPRMPFEQLNAQAQWQIKGEKIALELKKISFENADASGTAQATWQTAEGSGAARFPGLLQLEGTLDRAQGNRVWRYLPLQIPQEARDYVQHSVQAGQGSLGRFKVAGNLLDIPSSDPKKSTFFISTHIDQGSYQYVPEQFLPAGSKPWPKLSNLSGELVFDGNSMQVRDAQGTIDDLQVEHVNASIADWDESIVSVQGQLSGDLGAVLQTVKQSAIGDFLSGALSEFDGRGASKVDLNLQLPIADLSKSTLQGTLQLANNALQVSPQIPPLSQLQGQVQFSDNGFVFHKVQGQSLGHPLQVSGGMGPLIGRAAHDASVHLQAAGKISSEALRQQNNIPSLAKLAEHMQGSAAYQLKLALQGGGMDVDLSSNLQGMALRLPAPFDKPAASSLALRLQSRGLAVQNGKRTHDQIQMDWGPQFSLLYQRDLLAASPRVQRGLIQWGAAKNPAALPAEGVQANITLDTFSLDAWQNLLSEVWASTPALQNANTQSYLPNKARIEVGTLTAQGRTLHQVQAQIAHQGNAWTSQLESLEASGTLDYKIADDGRPGRLTARLKRLDLGQAQTAELEDALIAQPANIPSLDIVIDAFTLRGKELGRVEMDAGNHGGTNDANREWRLNKLKISNPESRLNAVGVWLAGSPTKTTVLNVKWDIDDSGKLLARLGTPHVLAKGKGKIEGQVSWQGSPLSVHYPSMNGKLQLDMHDGRFLQADPGIAKLLGVLSLQALPRRLALDFRDVFSQGFAYDFVRGDIGLRQGVASTNNLQMKGLNAAVLMEGFADVKDETQDLHVVVIPEINAGTASLIATAINPAIGIGTFLAQMILRKPLGKAATQEFRITGSWLDPKVEKLTRKSPAANSSAP